MRLRQLLLVCAAAFCMPPAIARTPYRNPVPDRMPIVAWVGLPDSLQTPARYREMQAAGFNLSISELHTDAQVEKSLLAAEGSGVGIIVRCDPLITHPRQTVDRFKGYPAVAGWYLGDEPSAARFDAIGALLDSVTAADAGHLPYVNLFPEWAGERHTGVASYSRYLREFLRKVDIPFLSYDCYPFVLDAGGSLAMRPDFFQNFVTVSEVARANGIPFWAFCLSTAHGDYPVATEGMLAVEAFSALAYGAQGIQYYTYWSWGGRDRYREGPLNPQGRRTAVYDLVTGLNREIQALASIFLGCRVADVSYCPAEGEDSVPQGLGRLRSLPKPFSGSLTVRMRDVATPGSSLPSGVLVSRFRGGDGADYLMLVNVNPERACSVEAPYSGRLEMLLSDGSSRSARQRMNLRPGGHVIYRLNPR